MCCVLSHLSLPSSSQASRGKCPLQWESDVSHLDLDHVISSQEVGTVLKGDVMNCMSDRTASW